MKFQKVFQPGAHRLGNLFNKDEVFRKLLCEENILKIAYAVLGDDIKIGALDMREPKKGEGSQDIHIDWIAKKIENEEDNIERYKPLLKLYDQANIINEIINNYNFQ